LGEFVFVDFAQEIHGQMQIMRLDPFDFGRCAVQSRCAVQIGDERLGLGADRIADFDGDEGAEGFLHGNSQFFQKPQIATTATKRQSQESLCLDGTQQGLARQGIVGADIQEISRKVVKTKRKHVFSIPPLRLNAFA
jgi:hypothetical protein